jgi:hypothetical protein
MTSLKEKQVDKMLDKIIGNGDDALKIITKLALTNTEITPEVLATLDYLKKQNEEDAKALNEELNMTLDASGNIVPVNNNITFTIENGVINNVNGVIDCGGNLVYRLPVGKT